MKRFLFFLLLLPFFCVAQKLKLSEYDKFIKQRRMETFPVVIKGESGARLAISFNSVGSNFYLQMTGSGVGANIIDANDKLIFQFDIDSTLNLPSKGYQSYDLSADEITYNHSYIVSLSDLEKLSKGSIQSIRKTHADKFDDIAIVKESADKLKALSAYFANEIRKSDVLKKQTMVTPPGFPGGYEVWMKFLKRNLKMPLELGKDNKKTVLVQFLVKTDGSVDEMKIVESQGASFDNEVLRVLKRMPKWKSAFENEHPAEAVVTQAIVFSYNDSSISSR